MLRNTEKSKEYLYNNQLSAKELPGGLVTYTKQVGGLNPSKPPKSKFLHSPESGTIFKILSRQPKGFNEARFYVDVFDPKRDCELLIQNLRNFLPAYRGLYHRPETEDFLIALEDMHFGLPEANSMDVKLGRRSYICGASPRKITTENNKYSWRDTLGFFITGIRVNGEFFNRTYGASLTPMDVYERGICLFLDVRNPTTSREVRLEVCRLFESDLASMISWFQEQRLFNFVASSLLFCYSLQPMKSRLRLIDFARSSPMQEKSTPDENCLFGLLRLQSYFERAGSELSTDSAVDRV